MGGNVVPEQVKEIRDMKGLASSVILAGMILVVPAEGSVIGVGLDWRKNVFVQEYWQDGVPHYVLANLGSTAIQITVHERTSGVQLAGPWEIKPRSVTFVDARPLQGKDLVAFKLADGTNLGLLGSPVPPATPIKDAIATYDGLNGSGGRHNIPWFEQTSLTFRSGEVFEVKLMMQSPGGVVKFSRKGGNEVAISQLPLVEAVCPSLAVKVSGDQIQIDANRPLQPQKIHPITLRFRAPEVKSPTLFMITGWRATSGGSGHGVTRGIVVK
jgi:hypothetical protein